MKSHILLIAAVCLTACSPQADKTSESASAALSEGQPVIVSSAAPPVVDAMTIPASFVGQWDASLATCNLPSDMRLTVKPTRLSFYESGGEVRKVTAKSPTDIVVDVAMSGEGETWERTLRMVLTDTGNKLTIDAGEGGVRVRCP